MNAYRTVSLDAETTALPASPIIKRLSRRFVWSLGLAASVALAAGLLWNSPFVRKSSMFQAGALVHENGTALQTELPPELIEGTPPPIRLPLQTPMPN
jgi:hypothetical protein